MLQGLFSTMASRCGACDMCQQAEQATGGRQLPTETRCLAAARSSASSGARPAVGASAPPAQPALDDTFTSRPTIKSGEQPFSDPYPKLCSHIQCSRRGLNSSLGEEGGLHSSELAFHASGDDYRCVYCAGSVVHHGCVEWHGPPAAVSNRSSERRETSQVARFIQR